MGFEFLTHSHSVPTSFGSSTSSVPRCAPWCACGLRSAAPCFAGIPIVGWRYRCCHGGSPIAGWFIMGNPIKMDDLGVTPFFEISILYMLYIYVYFQSSPIWAVPSFPKGFSTKMLIHDWDDVGVPRPELMATRRKGVKHGFVETTGGWSDSEKCNVAWSDSVKLCLLVTFFAWSEILWTPRESHG